MTTARAVDVGLTGRPCDAPTLRVLMLLSDGFGGRGGIAKFNRDLLCALCSSPNVVEVVALPRVVEEELGSMPSKLRYQLGGVGGLARYGTAFLKQLQEDRAFDLVVCGHINLLPFSSLAARVSGAHHALVVHGVEAWQPSPRRLANWLVREVDSFWAVSDFTRQRFAQWAPVELARGHVVSNCVDLARFRPGPKPNYLEQRYGLGDCRIIMTVARLAASECYKGIDEILERMPGLISRVPELRYLIVGDGDDRIRLEAKRASLGLDSHVVFAGRIAEQEKVHHYQLADAFVMPSRGEGFGIVFIEALACGTPVLAGSRDASGEAVANSQLSVLVDPDDASALEAGILSALDMPKGTQPRSVQEFSYARFEERVHARVNAMADERHGTPSLFHRAERSGPTQP